MKDRYWHIQMFLPEGKGGVVIDSIQMLKEKEPIIGTGEWNDIQCQYFKGERNGLAIGDIVMVREGNKPLALCEIIGDCFHDDSLTKKYINYWFRHVKILEWAKSDEHNNLFSQGTLKILYKKSDTYSWHYINDWYKNILQKKEMKNLTDLLLHKKQIILQGAPGTGKTYIAKDIAELLIFNEVSTDKKQQANRLESSNQFELVQFHPSYTYEDFVRGIEVKTEKGQPEYVTCNKTLGEFAKKALENKELYRSYQENRLKEEIEYKSKFSQFIDSVQEEIDGVGKYQLTTNVYLFEYDDTRFKYKGDNWEAHASGLNMKYTELQKVFEAGVTERSSIKKLANIESLTSSHATYYSKMAEKFASFDYNSSDESIDPIELQKYVLIIDEINRANLPAVLGELIYALEYRGEKVNSMYAIDKDSSLVLPPNLYIIGTMNTADRSVGQIDYAIRRRFAFVDMLPTSLLNKVEGFDEELFKAVSELFIKSYETYEQTGIIEPSDYLSDEFRPEDVWIGHSYFIMSDNRDLRLTYEIKPILKEYVKDGIFKDVQVVEKKIQELA